MTRKRIAVGAAALMFMGGLLACDGPTTVMDAAVDGMVRLRDAMSDDAEAQDGGGSSGPTRVEVTCEVVATLADSTDGDSYEHRLWVARLEDPSIVPGETRVEAQACDWRRADGMAAERIVLRCDSSDGCVERAVFGTHPACASAPVELTAGRAEVLCGETSEGARLDGTSLERGERWARAVFWVH